jgi:hypothetical protein
MIFKSIKNNLFGKSRKVTTAKEMQLALVKMYLKPLLKQNGYSTSAQTWWRDQGNFFVVINLQNFSWNNEDDITFCFNIGIALKATMQGPATNKAGYKDLTIHLRDSAYLSDLRTKSRFKSNDGYVIDSKTDDDAFLKEFKIDFEQEILPCLDRLKTIGDCLNFYGTFPFWGDHLKGVLIRHNISY